METGPHSGATGGGGVSGVRIRRSARLIAGAPEETPSPSISSPATATKNSMSKDQKESGDTSKDLGGDSDEVTFLEEIPASPAPTTTAAVAGGGGGSTKVVVSQEGDAIQSKGGSKEGKTDDDEIEKTVIVELPVAPPSAAAEAAISAKAEDHVDPKATKISEKDGKEADDCKDIEPPKAFATQDQPQKQLQQQFQSSIENDLEFLLDDDSLASSVTILSKETVESSIKDSGESILKIGGESDRMEVEVVPESANQSDLEAAGKKDSMQEKNGCTDLKQADVPIDKNPATTGMSMSSINLKASNLLTKSSENDFLDDSIGSCGIDFDLTKVAECDVQGGPSVQASSFLLVTLDDKEKEGEVPQPLVNEYLALPDVNDNEHMAMLMEEAQGQEMNEDFLTSLGLKRKPGPEKDAAADSSVHGSSEGMDGPGEGTYAPRWEVERNGLLNEIEYLRGKVDRMMERQMLMEDFALVEFSSRFRTFFHTREKLLEMGRRRRVVDPACVLAPGSSYLIDILRVVNEQAEGELEELNLSEQDILKIETKLKDLRKRLASSTSSSIGQAAGRSSAKPPKRSSISNYSSGIAALPPTLPHKFTSNNQPLYDSIPNPHQPVLPNPLYAGRTLTKADRLITKQSANPVQVNKPPPSEGSAMPGQFPSSNPNMDGCTRVNSDNRPITKRTKVSCDVCQTVVDAAFFRKIHFQQHVGLVLACPVCKEPKGHLIRDVNKCLREKHGMSPGVLEVLRFIKDDDGTLRPITCKEQMDEERRLYLQKFRSMTAEEKLKVKEDYLKDEEGVKESRRKNGEKVDGEEEEHAMEEDWDVKNDKAAGEKAKEGVKMTSISEGGDEIEIIEVIPSESKKIEEKSSATDGALGKTDSKPDEEYRKVINDEEWEIQKKKLEEVGITCKPSVTKTVKDTPVSRILKPFPVPTSSTSTFVPPPPEDGTEELSSLTKSQKKRLRKRKNALRAETATEVDEGSYFTKRPKPGASFIGSGQTRNAISSYNLNSGSGKSPGGTFVDYRGELSSQSNRGPLLSSFERFGENRNSLRDLSGRLVATNDTTALRSENAAGERFRVNPSSLGDINKAVGGIGRFDYSNGGLGDREVRSPPPLRDKLSLTRPSFGTERISRGLGGRSRPSFIGSNDFSESRSIYSNDIMGASEQPRSLMSFKNEFPRQDSQHGFNSEFGSRGDTSSFMYSFRGGNGSNLGGLNQNRQQMPESSIPRDPRMRSGGPVYSGMDATPRPAQYGYFTAPGNSSGNQLSSLSGAGVPRGGSSKPGQSMSYAEFARNTLLQNRYGEFR